MPKMHYGGQFYLGTKPVDTVPNLNFPKNYSHKIFKKLRNFLIKLRNLLLNCAIF